MLYAVLALMAFGFGYDASRPPARQVSNRVVLGAIQVYQRFASPRVAAMGVRCNFTPTCSHYGEAVLRKYGILGGSWRAAWRVLRCGPWATPGTYDPPP